ncbi:glycoside hydrolase family 35 protein [Paenibacillus soyae]
MSGAIHYFRVVPEYWEDRLLKLRACGFNTVETYVAWNVHEPKEGAFCFEGIADLERFVRLAGELGLYVIVRPSPYICAEWEFGGLPAWLLSDSDMRLRCFDPAYLAKVDRYYDELIPRLVPLQSTNGGPIIAVQVENEYGSYGNDTRYLEYLRDGLLARSVDVLLFTSDGPTDEMLIGGTIEGVHATVNFGSRVEESFGKFREYRETEPLMCMEYWNGWFDHWMEPHHVRDGGDVAEVLDQMLSAGASVNFYMFHGGTNFGFYNGANHIKTYEPTVTSYDYDAPLTEWGDITPKYDAIRAVMEKHGFEAGCPLPEPLPKRSYGKVALSESGQLFPQLSKMGSPVDSVWTLPMEKVGQAYGFILYSTWVKGPRAGQQLHIQEVRDRAQVFLGGKPIGVVERWNPQPLALEVPAEGARLDILVENMGRVNYGPLLRDAKGITEGVRIDNQFQFDWTITPLPLDGDMLSRVTYQEAAAPNENQTAGMPAFYKGSFEAEEACDTFLRFDGWKKGVAWVNGFNLGRYWEAGPQKALYVPGPLLRKGANEIVLFELEGAAEDAAVTLTDKPDLGRIEAVDDSFLNFVGEDEAEQA